MFKTGVFPHLGFRLGVAFVTFTLASCAAKLNAPIPLEANSPDLITQNGFTLSPTARTISTGGTIAFSASGGLAPYTFELYYGIGTVQGESGLYTAPGVPGDAVVRAVDAEGAEAYAGILVTDSPVINPTSVALAAGNWYPFSVSGGSQPYAFSIASGEGSVDSATGKFTAGANAGSTTIRVTDAKGRISDAAVTITGQLSLTEDTVTVPLSESHAFSTSGGVPPIRYSILSGGGQIDASSGVYLAPATMGVAVVKAEDSLGNIDTAIVSLNNPLRVSPAQITLTQGSTYLFSAMGGKPAYTYSVSGPGHGSILEATGAYTAPGSAGGPYTVTVTDAEGATSSAEVTVNPSLSFILPNVTLAVGDTFDFSTIVSGGSGGISYSAPSSHGTFAGASYTAPASPGIYTITARDSQLPSPNTAQATVIVNPALSVSPATLTLAAGNTHSFSASGGVPPYSYSTSSGSIHTTSGAFISPASAGTVTVTVRDARLHEANATVTVNAAVAISHPTRTIVAGGSFDFDASGGVPPYTFSVASGGGSVVSSSGVYAAGGATGTATVRVSDSLGNSSDALVTIVAPLAIAPGSIFLQKGSGIVFSGSGGLPSYSFAVLSGGGTINSSTGAYTAPSTAGAATVQLADALGGTATASVTIYDGLAISPFSRVMTVGSSATFSSAGGVSPYSYSVISGGGTIHASSGVYTAPGAAGTTTVRVTDAQGNTSDAAVTIRPALSISPTSKTLSVGNGATFAAAGGIPPYSYSLAAGTGTISASSGDYTAPGTPGTATVRVTDAAGATADATVTVNGPISLSPASTQLVAGGSRTFTASGGVAPYAYSVAAGDGSITAGGDYTAGASSGSATVRATDSLGNFAESSISIYQPLAISPTSKTLSISNSFTFSASGGILPYTFSLVSGEGAMSAAGLYQAPAVQGTGTAQVRVRDSASPQNESVATITITGGLAISPATATVAAGATQSFSATGGVSPVSYSAIAGGGSFSGATFTAPSTAAGASVTVRATDSIGNTSDATISVPAITVAISSPTSSGFITNANKAAFTVSGTCSEEGRTVTVASSGVTSATPSCSSGAWSTTLDFSSVADGAITITANHSNTSGVPATQASVSLTRDATLPTVTITAPAAASYVSSLNQSALTVNGACSENGRTVTVTAGAASATPTCSGLAYSTSLDLTALGQGALTITADHQDAAGNAATQASVGVTKDTLISAPASVNDGTWWSSTSNSPTISWTTVADVDLSRYEVAIGTTAGSNDVADWISTGTTASKQFSGLSLIDGATYYASVRAVDAAGNASSVVPGDSFTVDASAPSAPGTITVGSAAADPLSQIPTLTFAASSDGAGSGISKYQVQIWDNSGPALARDWADATTSGAGTITLDYGEGSAFLSSGDTYFAKVRAVDAVGNASSTVQSGTWTVVIPPNAFNYTGADQSYVVPMGCGQVRAKLWGAGGGGSQTTTGGAGGFATGYLTVTPGETLTIKVGGGGKGAGRAGGGGRSEIRRGATSLLVAGAGGGASFMGVGGAAGGLVGSAGTGNGAGAGGTQSAGGGGSNPGAQFQGGSSSAGMTSQWGLGGWPNGGRGGYTNLISDGGGGGDGYYGGGGANAGDGGAGGGGSSYLGSAAGASTVAGSGATAPMTTDPDYAVGVAAGGATNSTDGGNGRVVLDCGPFALALEPTPIQVDTFRSVTFAAMGGQPPYVYSVFAGDGSINGSSGVYVAPDLAGTATVRVTDSEGATANASVTIVEAAVASCAALLAWNPESSTGLYSLDPDGTGGRAAFDAYCDMTGGGWTLVARVLGTSGAHQNSGAIGTITGPSSSSVEKLADADINALLGSSGVMKVTDDGGVAKAFFKGTFSATASVNMQASTSEGGSYAATCAWADHSGFNVWCGSNPYDPMGAIWGHRTAPGTYLGLSHSGGWNRNGLVWVK
ncbi:MAG: hypothetical protein NDJ89_03845 [Oligoflexia bacterium]|nr:hypothetical protein [Oligoflexia bacterium]